MIYIVFTYSQIHRYTGYKIIIFLAIIPLVRSEDYYEILGISRSADQDEIRKAFKKLAITHHPDKNSVCELLRNVNMLSFYLYSKVNNTLIFQDDPNAHDKFIRLTTAYEVLKDNDLRRKYDLYGEDGLDESNRKQTYHSWNYYRDSLIYEDDEYVILLERSDYCE